MSQSLMIIQLLTHYTKSILKSLINQLLLDFVISRDAILSQIFQKYHCKPV